MQDGNTLKFVTRIDNFINARVLNKRKFKLLLEDVHFIHKELVIYNNVLWLSRGHLLEWFIEYLHEIRLFLINNQKNYNFFIIINRIKRF